MTPGKALLASAGMQLGKRYPGEVLRSADVAYADSVETDGEFCELHPVCFQLDRPAPRRPVGLRDDQCGVTEQRYIAIVVLGRDFQRMDSCQPFGVAVAAATQIVTVIGDALANDGAFDPAGVWPASAVEEQLGRLTIGHQVLSRGFFVT